MVNEVSRVFDVKQMLIRQEAWQASRRLLSWPEKLRMAEAIRETVRVFADLRASSGGKALRPPTAE
jgi:hypothetical protein